MKVRTLDDVFRICDELITLEDCLKSTKNEEVLDVLTSEELSQRDQMLYMLEHENVFDKNKILLRGYMNGTRDLLKQGMDREKYYRIKEQLKTIASCLKKKNVSIHSRNLQGTFYESLTVHYSSEIIDGNINKRREKNRSRCEEITKQIDLKTLLKITRIHDVKEFYYDKDPSIGEDLNDMMCWNILLKYQFQSKEELEAEIEKNKEIEVSKEIDQEKCVDEMYALIYASREYIDFDKLLLICAKRAEIRLEEDEELSEEQKEELTKILTTANAFLKDSNIHIQGEIEVGDDNEIRNIRYTSKDLKKTCKNIVNEKYISKQEKETTREKLISGEILFHQLSQEMVSYLGLQNEELHKILQNEENFFAFVNQNEENNRKAKEIVLQSQEVPYSIIEYFDQTDSLEARELFELYMKEAVTIETMEKISHQTTMQDFLTPEMAVHYLRDPELQESFPRYSLLYRQVRQKDQTQEKLQEMSDTVIEALGDDFSDEELKKLYQAGLVTIGSMIDWNGKEIATELMAQGILRPNDTKQLIEKDGDFLNHMKHLLKQSTLSEAEKLTLIYSTFDQDYQDEIRNELMQCLKLGTANRMSKQQTLSERKRLGEGKTRGNEYILDPYLRWKLISEFDKDYSQEMAKDGHMIFHCPNIQNGMVQIEHFYKSTKNGNKMAYGEATYFMSEEMFEQQKNHILDENGMVNRRVLKELAQEGDAVKFLHHKGWGKAIKRYLNIDFSQDQTREEQINETIKRIEDTRRML